MDGESRGFGCKTLLLVLVFALLMGVVGGGVTGGALTLYFMQQMPAQSAAAINAVPASQNLPAAVPQTQVLKQDSAIVDSVKKSMPSVVTVISTVQSQRGGIFGPRTRQAQALGTGIIIDAKGYIVTNNHVVEGAQKVDILFINGDKVTATVVGTDAFSDLALLQVTGKTMPAVAEMGDSSALQIGEPVIAIGQALGDYQDTVTVGVVSGLNRKIDGNANSALEGLIQTDAAINHGNSGGPLLNAEGQVIGINTLVVRSDPGGDVAEGLGFAIPSNTVKQVTSQLMSGGKVSRPFLGVTYTMLNAQIAGANNVQAKSGAWIQDVTAGSPASKAGLKADDVITAINGQTLSETTPMVSVLQQYKVGDTLTLTVLRGGNSISIKVTLGERPAT